MAGAQRNIPSLDGFRAVSIFLVITGHLLLTTPLPGVLAFLPENFNVSGVGVNFFFVISGFLITYLLLKEREKTNTINFAAFYKRRFLRIFPAFYCYLLIIAILDQVLDLDLSFAIWIAAALYLQNFSPWGHNWYVEHSWSLAVEEQFYIIWPFLFVKFSALKRVSALVAVISTCTMVRIINYKYPEAGHYLLAGFLMHADFLFTGCFMAYQYFYNTERLKQVIRSLNPSLVYISILALWVVSRFEYDPDLDKIFIPIAGPVGCACIAFLVLYFIVNEESIGYSFLNASVVRFIGRLSYSLYLWQQLFISTPGLWFTKFPLNILMIFFAALGSYYLIEQPFLRLKKKFRAF